LRKSWADLTKEGRTRLSTNAEGLKEKDLMMVPARVALALQADGWWVRSEIVWAKPNPMPESVTDRPTSSHEKVFLLAKSARYFFDGDAVREEAECARIRGPALHGDLISTNGNGGLARRDSNGVRNIRNVWEIATAPYAGAHFATFPPELAERCVRAGTSERGCCARCGAPWVRVVERQSSFPTTAEERGHPARYGDTDSMSAKGFGMPSISVDSITTGWSPSCACGCSETVPAVVLDPFAGAGTVGLVADRQQRDAVLIELNPAYAEMARRRIEGDAPLFAEVRG
jgi:hypothetical protein